MKRFEMHEHRAAIRYAQEGGQALHVMDHSGGVYNKAPKCFQQTNRFAHLFDQDANRLTKTAKRLGVRRIYIDAIRTHKQHVDLCGKPLERALAQCERDQQEAKP